MDTIRVLRVIEFVGPREAVERQLANSLHGEKRLPSGVTIKVATLGLFPEVLSDLPVVDGFGNYDAAEATQ